MLHKGKHKVIIASHKWSPQKVSKQITTGEGALTAPHNDKSVVKPYGTYAKEELLVRKWGALILLFAIFCIEQKLVS